MNTKEMIEVMEAWLAGAELQYRIARPEEEWHDFSNKIEPSWDWDTYEWRVRPKGKRKMYQYVLQDEHGIRLTEDFFTEHQMSATTYMGCKVLAKAKWTEIEVE